MISLRHLLKSDFSDLKKFVSDDKVTKYLTWQSYSDDKKISNFLEKSIRCIDFPNEYLAIISDGKLIGTIHLIDRENGCLQFGFGITSDLWNRGIGSKAVDITINYIKNSKWADSLNEIWADVHKDNFFAKKILLKNDFKYFGYIDKKKIRERYKLIWTII